MALLYLDTSALVKLYVSEAGSSEMLRLIQPAEGHNLLLLNLARVELRSALRRRVRAGDFTAPAADQMLRDFQQHLTSLFRVVLLHDAISSAAEVLIDRYTLRAYDAVQLGACVVLRASVSPGADVRFVASDITLLEAATREGFVAIDPARP